MTRPVCIDCFAALTAEGMVFPGGCVPWESDQNGPEDLRRPQVLNRPYPSFGKLMLPDKLAFGVASLMLSRYRGTLDQDTGVCVALPFGSLSTDLRYNETVRDGAVSPAIFSATLPSSPVTEIAIFYKLKGPNRAFAGGSNPAFDAFEAACLAAASGKASSVIAISVSALERQDRDSPLLGSAPATPVEAFAVLVRNAPGAHLRVACDLTYQGPGGAAVGVDGTDYFRSVIELLRQHGGGCLTATVGAAVTATTLRQE